MTVAEADREVKAAGSLTVDGIMKLVVGSGMSISEGGCDMAVVGSVMAVVGSVMAVEGVAVVRGMSSSCVLMISMRAKGGLEEVDDVTVVGVSCLLSKRGWYTVLEGETAAEVIEEEYSAVTTAVGRRGIELSRAAEADSDVVSWPPLTEVGLTTKAVVNITSLVHKVSILEFCEYPSLQGCELAVHFTVAACVCILSHEIKT